ncbi:MAG: ComEA family DNA-binding protein [Selenomonadaceae bacterium]|nr:ComEA family DNA-binding protein [Selenomonadaceae bacterium]
MPMHKRSLLIFLALVTLGTVGTLYGYYNADSALPVNNGERVEEARPSEKITVYVTGAVNQPGLATLEANSRVADAVNLCGGVTPLADADNINMAQILKDGQQLKVPEKSLDSPVPDSPATPTNGAASKVSINTADAKTLETLPGIGPAMAKRIMDFRAEEGAFTALEDLKKIRGIGEAKFAKLKDLITL